MLLFLTVSLLSGHCFGAALDLSLLDISPTSGNNTLSASSNRTPISPPYWWHSEPAGRGTFDILTSCFVTLLFAAWTSYHPNIPQTGSTVTTRMRWLFVAAFVPEIVLWRAWSQFWAARRLMLEINKLGKACYAGNDVVKHFPTCSDGSVSESISQTHQPLGPRSVPHSKTWNGKSVHRAEQERSASPEKSSEERKFVSWTMTEALFAVAGGIAVEAVSFFPSKSLAFTPRGILQLARSGVLPRLDREEIEDKNKADVFAKFLVCLQALWFVTHSCARLAQHLPLTLLEVHCMIHVLCAFGIYAIWFFKPYDVGRPYFCEDERAVDLAAFFALQPHHLQPNPFNDDSTYDSGSLCCTHANSVTIDHARTAHAYPTMPFLHGGSAWELFSRSRKTVDALKASEQYRRAIRAIARLHSRDMHIPWADHEPDPCNGNESSWTGLEFRDGPYVVPRTSNLLVAGGLKKRDFLPPALLRPNSSNSTTTPPKAGTSAAAAISDDRVAQVTSAYGKTNIAIKIFHLDRIALWFFSAAYGGLHLSAWFFAFPTRAEMWLWRSAGIWLATAPALTPLIAIVGAAARAAKRRADGVSEGEMRGMGAGRRSGGSMAWRCVYVLLRGVELAFGGVVLQVLAYYIPARMFLLGESLAQLRAPAPGTYEDVAWTVWLPHFY